MHTTIKVNQHSPSFLNERLTERLLYSTELGCKVYLSAKQEPWGEGDCVFMKAWPVTSSPSIHTTDYRPLIPKYLAWLQTLLHKKQRKTLHYHISCSTVLTIGHLELLWHAQSSAQPKNPRPSHAWQKNQLGGNREESGCITTLTILDAGEDGWQNCWTLRKSSQGAWPVNIFPPQRHINHSC